MAHQNSSDSLLNSKSLELVKIELSSREIPLIVVETFILASISLASVLGNLLILMAIYRSPRLKSPTNYLIISLASSDLLTALVVVPMSTGVLATGKMFMGVEGCKAFGCLSVLLSNMTFYTVGLIAFNRFLLALNLKWYGLFFSSKATIMTIVSSWVFQSIFAILPAISNWSEVSLSPGYTTCTLFVTNPVAKRIYRTQSELQMIGGLLIISLCFTFVFVKTKKTKSILPKEQKGNKTNDHLELTPVQGDTAVVVRQSSPFLFPDSPNTLQTPEETVPCITTTFCGSESEHGNPINEDRREFNIHRRYLQEIERNEPGADDREKHLEVEETSDVNEEQKYSPGFEMEGSSSNNDTGSDSDNRDQERLQRVLSQLKTTKLLFTVSLCFLFSWIPLAVLIVVESYQSMYASRQVQLLAITLLYLGTTFNPIVLPVMSRHFRTEFLKMLCIRRTAAVHPQP